MRLIAPGLSQSEQCLPTCVEEASEYSYAGLNLYPARPMGPPPSNPPHPYPPPQQVKPKHCMSLPLQSSQVSPPPQQPDTVDEDDSHSNPPPPPPQHAKPKHRRSLPPQSSPILPRPQLPDTIEEDAYEEMEVPDGDKSLRQEKVQVPVNWKLSQPQASRPSPPVSPPCPDPSTKPKPKGVPSMAIPLIPAASPHTQHPPPVSKKPITLSE